MWLVSKEINTHPIADIETPPGRMQHRLDHPTPLWLQQYTFPTDQWCSNFDITENDDGADN